MDGLSARGASAGALFLLCRHAGRESPRGGMGSSLNPREVRQAQGMARALLDGVGGEPGCACIVTSEARCAMVTGAVVQASFPCVRLCHDAALDGRDGAWSTEAESDARLFVRIQRAVRSWLQAAVPVPGSLPGSKPLVVIFITHAAWIHACMRLFGLSPSQSSFFRVPFASVHRLEFPPLDRCVSGGWGFETPADFERRREEVALHVSRVARVWRDLPTRTWGRSKVLWQDSDWVVRTDVWKMERWRQRTGHMPLLAIAVSDELRCLRDLNEGDVGALRKLDRAYPDDEWVKYLLYPPFVWRLHVHIQHRSCPMVYRNVYFLRDVIAMVSGMPGGGAGPVLLVCKY